MILLVVKLSRLDVSSTHASSNEGLIFHLNLFTDN